MGYLNNQSIIVDAILTKKGRELLAKGRDQFKITQYALADDEIDYSLWNAAHSGGSTKYGEAIEKLPLLEAIPDETQIMRYKLVTLPKATSKMPMIEVVEGSSIQFTTPGQTKLITPTTTAGLTNDTLGYTLILHNSDAAEVSVVTEAPGYTGGNTPIFMSDLDEKQSISAVGIGFELIAKRQPIADLSTQITIIGNETGGTKTINLVVKKTVAELSALPAG
tara:strand:- start:468 stop:1133 length:666 start_codon:yes stop_codon:yes gene_type:complete